MGERAECPQCKAYLSQLYYEGRHDWCGYGYGRRIYIARMEAVAKRQDSDYGKLASMEVQFEKPLTDDQVLAVKSAFAQALGDAWGDAGEPSFSVHVDLSGDWIDRSRIENSPWWFGTVAEGREWLDTHPPKGSKWTHPNTARAHWKRIAKLYGLDGVPAVSAR